jgi:hypothetical protein
VIWRLLKRSEIRFLAFCPEDFCLPRLWLKQVMGRKVPLYRIPDVETVKEMPDTKDIEWSGYEYISEFEGTENNSVIHSFELETDEQSQY